MWRDNKKIEPEVGQEIVMAYRIEQGVVFLLAGEVKRRGDEVLYLEDGELTEVLPERFFWIPLPERPAIKDF